jgi:hypothetical protein
MAAVFRFGTRRAFLTTLVPVLILLPTDFYLRVKHLPPLSFVDAALFSLGVGLILMDVPQWRFTRMDCWIVVFLFSATYSERIPWGTTGAVLRLITLVLECVVPYIAGKMLVEQPGMRVETVRRVVTLMAIISVLSMPEFFLSANPNIHFWSHFFPGQWPENRQVRWGHGRVGGPYGGSEQAGMVIMIGLSLAVWLQGCKYFRAGAAGVKYPLFKHSRTIIFVLVAMLILAQARGPWIGTVVALSVASIGRAKHPLRRAVLVFSLGVLVGVPAHSAFKEYISGPLSSVDSERATAQYRSQLIDNYIPIAKNGGAWGWGNVFPNIGGQSSIDNEYLLIWLVQGYVGLAALILIFVDASGSFLRLAIMARSFQERYFDYTLLGIVLGLGICSATVWLTCQSFILFFLIVGWSQAIRPSEAGSQQFVEERVNRELQHAVAVRVYT